MIEHKWIVLVNGVEEECVWDSVSQILLAPTVVSFRAQKLVDDEVVVEMTPVGPRMVADLDEPMAAWATVSYAIYLSGYELVGGSPAPMEPETELVAGNPTSD